MRNSRWTNLIIALTIFVGSSTVYPASAQSMCGLYAYHHQYWDSVDAQGNCPIFRVTLVGERSLDCNWNYVQWGQIGGCDVESTYWYCGDCQLEP